MRQLLVLLALLLVVAPTTLRAQEGASALSEPEPGRRRAAPEPSEPSEPEATVEPDEFADWAGPRVELSFARYRLTDGRGEGQVLAGGFGGYYVWKYLRFGAYGEMGVRRYALGNDDVLVRGSVLLGGQWHPTLGGRFLPYAVLEGSVGVVAGKRFRTTQSDFLRGMGFRVGADVRLVRTLWFGVSFGYLRAGLGDLAHDVFSVRLKLGL